MATLEQVRELKEKTAKERQALIEAVRTLSADDLMRVPVDAEGEEQWTALEQLAHLAEMERGYVAWVGAALREDNPDTSQVAVGPVAIPIEAANEHSVDELLDQMADLRRVTLGLIDRMELEDFDRTATSPVFGTLTALQWLRSFYRHDRQHAAQIAGRKSDYQPNFKGKEPNQRKMRLEAVRRRQEERHSG